MKTEKEAILEYKIIYDNFISIIDITKAGN